MRVVIVFLSVTALVFVIFLIIALYESFTTDPLTGLKYKEMTTDDCTYARELLSEAKKSGMSEFKIAMTSIPNSKLYQLTHQINEDKIPEKFVDTCFGLVSLPIDLLLYVGAKTAPIVTVPFMSAALLEIKDRIKQAKNDRRR